MILKVVFNVNRILLEALSPNLIKNFQIVDNSEYDFIEGTELIKKDM